MIVTGCLVWWNERPKDLAACVAGMGWMDRLVAVDGSYSRYPEATIRSPKTQEQTIRETAEAVGLEVEVVIPKRLWAGQVEKRSYALAHAAEGSDWIAVVDADWRLYATGDVRGELEGYGRQIDVVSVPFYTPPAKGEPATGWHQSVSDTTSWLPHLFRALPEIMVERYHWQYSARKGRDRVWLWGNPDASKRLVPAHHLEAEYRIEHLTLRRTRKQVLASRAFINDRQKVIALTNQEDDLPGLFRPEFDYETVPLVNIVQDRRMRRRAELKAKWREQHAMRLGEQKRQARFGL